MRFATLLRDIARNRLGLVNLPRFLTYIVTFKCNARCVMCDCWKKPSPDELTLEEIEHVFRQLPRMDGVRLSGGEPFVRQDLAGIAELATRMLRPRFLHVTTNGFLTSRVVEFCEKRSWSVPLHLLISLDGTEEKHNEVRGRETAWETTLATVQALAPRQGELRLKLSVNQTIVDREGVSENRKLREFLRPLGIHVNAVVAYDASATYAVEQEKVVAPTSAAHFSTFGEFGPDDAEKLSAELEAGLGDMTWPERLAKKYYLAGIRNRLLDRVGDPNPKCVALNSHMRLFPNGDVPVCQFNSRRVGNLRKETFAQVWHGVRITPHREWVKRCPGCWAECEVLPNAFYSGDVVRFALTNLAWNRPAKAGPVRLERRACSNRGKRPGSDANETRVTHNFGRLHSRENGT
jgi:MoaA/NifB/PqqE/SkfB family radical SAM enzyme